MTACITAIGAHTSLGSAAQSAAAYRGGMSRAQELKAWPYFDNATKHEQFVLGHPAAGVDAGFQGLGRLLKIAKFAFSDLVSNIHESVLPECPIVWALPAAVPAENFVIDFPVEFDRFLAQLESISGLPGIKQRSVGIFRGRIATALAIEHALTTLDPKGCMVAALDTNLDASRLSNWIDEDAVKTDDQPAGPMPGEAVNVMLIENGLANNSSPQIVGVRTDVAKKQDEEATEHTAFEHADGVQLAEAITQVWRKEEVAENASGTIYCDLNGSEGRANDFGNALIRALKACSFLGAWPTSFPIVSFGDTGAAHMGLAICLATEAWRRGYHHGAYSLITGRSVYGDSAAVLLKGS